MTTRQFQTTRTTPSGDVRERRKKILESVRGDWVFEPSALRHIGGLDAEERQEVIQGEDEYRAIRENEVEEWRERTYAPSDPSSSSDSDDDHEPTEDERDEETHGEEDTHLPDTEELQQKTRKLDIVTDEEVLEARKRKARTWRRRKRLREEMSFNPGLRFWEARRDAWTCARHHLPATTTTTQSPAIPLTPGSSLLPLSPPLLPPSDPALSFLRPENYSTLYTNIVQNSMVPSIPIPLAHMVPALVVGWKRDGEWPAQSTSTPTTLTEPGAGKKKAKAITGDFGFEGTNDRAGGAGGAGCGLSGMAKGSTNGVLKAGTARLERHLSSASRRLFGRSNGGNAHAHVYGSPNNSPVKEKENPQHYRRNGDGHTHSHSNGSISSPSQKNGTSNGHAATNGVQRPETPVRPNRASVDGVSMNSGSGTLSGGSPGGGVGRVGGSPGGGSGGSPNSKNMLKGVAKVGRVLKVSLGGGRGSANALGVD